MADVRAGVGGAFVNAQARNGARNIGAELDPQLIGVSVAGIDATRREGIPPDHLRTPGGHIHRDAGGRYYEVPAVVHGATSQGNILAVWFANISPPTKLGAIHPRLSVRKKPGLGQGLL